MVFEVPSQDSPTSGFGDAETVIDAERIFHVIDPRQFSRDQLEQLCRLATSARRLAKTPMGARALQTLLPQKRAMLYFTQPSTRTFLSFLNACHMLGIRTSEIRDPATSSEVKGESFKDSIRTFSSYVELIIMRTRGKGLARQAVELMESIYRPVPIVNAGSGKDQHPTQALLDIYTLSRSFAHAAGVDGKVIGFMGDLARGRTVRSLARLMCLYRNMTLYFIAPKDFQMDSASIQELTKAGVRCHQTDDLLSVIHLLDVIYVTRVQSEYAAHGSNEVFDHHGFALRKEHLRLLRKDSVIMHPLPRGPELSPDIDSDPRAMYWRQERNGMWIRVALLITIFNKQQQFIE